MERSSKDVVRQLLEYLVILNFDTAIVMVVQSYSLPLDGDPVAEDERFSNFCGRLCYHTSRCCPHRESTRLQTHYGPHWRSQGTFVFSPEYTSHHSSALNWSNY